MDKDKPLIESLIKTVKELTGRVEKLESENNTLREENNLFKAEIVELKAQINTNSHNSNKPPSSDGYKKKPAIPRKRNGKQGGQQGHQGRTLRQVKYADKVVKHKPGPCDCGHEFSDAELSVAETRQVFDLPQPRLEVTAHELLKGKCPVCGKWHKGVAPKGVNAPVQYGHGVKTLTTLLNVDYRIPFKKIQVLFSDLFGYAINESTVYSATKQCHKQLKEPMEAIKTKIIESITAHADETGIRVGDMLNWLHVASTELYTYLFVHEKRGRAALESGQSILDKLTGWLVHDCWGSYFNFNELHHALCGAHIHRELEGLIENEQSKWARVFKTYMLYVFEMPLGERGKRRQQIEARYTLICGMGEKSEPPPRKTPGQKGRYKRTKGRNLVERLIKEKDAVLAFAFNPEVPFTNNLAERDVRPVKVKMKVSNCFRTFEGADIYARIASFVSTTRKHDRNVFSELYNTFDGYNFLTR
jgi:transposase